MTLLKRACFVGLLLCATLWHAGCASTDAQAATRRSEVETFTKFVKDNNVTAIIQVDSDGQVGVYQNAEVGIQVPLKWHATVFNNPYGDPGTAPVIPTAAGAKPGG